MKTVRVLGLGIAIWWVFAPGLEAAESKMPLAKNPPKVAIDANRARFTKVTGGDFDDRTQKVQLEVVVRNLNLNVPSIEGLTLHYWALAQSVVDRKACLVIDAGSVEVKLDNTLEGREMRHKGEEVSLMLDNTGVSQFGQSYKGFLLVLLNDRKEVVAVKSNQPSWQTYFERAFALSKGAWCDLNLKPYPAPRY